MLLQMNRLSLKSPLRLLTVLVFHLLTHSCKGQSQLIGPSRPIVAIVGDDIILPCYLEPAEDVTADILEWTRSDLKPGFVHVLRSGQDLENERNPSYKGRTSLIIEELKHGNISLKLSKVKLSDKGTYKCDILIRDKQAFVELVVGSASSPVVSLAGLDRGGVVLQCECKGWYPEPEVLWLDGEGNLLSAGPTETVRGPDDLYTVSSRVTVEKRHSNSFTCRVQQNHINQTRDTHITVADDLFMVQASSAVRIIICLAVCFMSIAAVVFVVWKCGQNKRQKAKIPTFNDTELQVLMDVQIDGEQTCESVKMKCVDMKKAKLDEELQKNEEELQHVKDVIKTLTDQKKDLKNLRDKLISLLQDVKMQIEENKKKLTDKTLVDKEKKKAKREKAEKDLKKRLEELEEMLKNIDQLLETTDNMIMRMTEGKGKLEKDKEQMNKQLKETEKQREEIQKNLQLEKEEEKTNQLFNNAE